MARNRLTRRLNALSAYHASREQSQGAALVVLLIGDEDPEVLTAEYMATLAWEQQQAIIGPRTKVVLLGYCSQGPQ
jgi:hypothetical protein